TMPAFSANTARRGKINDRVTIARDDERLCSGPLGCWRTPPCLLGEVQAREWARASRAQYWQHRQQCFQERLDPAQTRDRMRCPLLRLLPCHGVPGMGVGELSHRRHGLQRSRLEPDRCWWL